MELKEEEIAEMTERQEAVQLELQRARDELRVERAKWKEEMDTVTQVSAIYLSCIVVVVVIPIKTPDFAKM